jgi:mevalonate kinase
MTEAKTKTLPIDYFASFGIGNRILKVLHDIPFEKLRHGGYSEQETKKALREYTRELVEKRLVSDKGSKEKAKESHVFGKKSKSGGERSIVEKLDHLHEAGQVEVSNQIGDTPRYKLSTNTLFYVHSLFSTTLDFRTVIEKDLEPPQFKQPSDPGGSFEPFLDEIILAPGSLILAGDHSALLGQPAVVLPIPLYLMVHATVCRYERNTVVHFYETFPDSYTSYGEMSSFPGTPVANWDIQDATFKLKIARVAHLFQKKLTDHTKNSADKAGYHVVLRIRSQIPPCDGLGSSGALCVALAILLDRIINHEEKNPLENLHQKDLDNLFKDKVSRLREIFLNATEFEREIHGETSGVGPFASLVGRDCFTPIWYDLGGRPGNGEACAMSELLDQRKEGRTYVLNLECRRGSAKASEYLSKDIGVAAVYSTQSRQDLKTTLADDAYRKALRRPDCRRDFVEITEKLWNNLCHGEKENRCEDDIEDVVTCVNLFGGYEEGYLKMLRAENEATARELIYRMRGVGLGAKYTGAGFGGDIVLIGPKEKVSTMLIPNYFPLHFTNVNLTHKSPSIDVEAYPSIIRKDEFVSRLMPQFLNRAKRAWRYY